MSAATTFPATKMLRVSRGGHIVGTLRYSDLANHGDVLTRAKYELAQMVGGQLARSILRGKASLYSIDAKSNLITYWFIPYTI